MTVFQKRLWIGLIVLALLTPLGIILPEKFKAEEAWGEWGAEKLEKLLGYLPEGLKKWADFWKAPIPDYNLGGDEASMTVQILSYIASGLLGIGICVGAVYLVSRWIVRNGK